MLRVIRSTAAVGAVLAGAGALTPAASASVGPVYDSCTEAHEDGVWNIPQSDDAYWEGGDRDDDGIACESYS